MSRRNAWRNGGLRFADPPYKTGMEYLIRRSDGEWFDLTVGQYAVALSPILHAE